MSRILVRCSFLIIWFGLLDGEVYQDRPKIKTSDGNLILEPAYGKSIYLLPNGPQSKIFVGETNILNGTAIKNDVDQNSDMSSTLDSMTTMILQRLNALENKDIALPGDYYQNISMLWRRINNINRRVTNLQIRLDNIFKDDCKTDPCLHGGTCLNLVSGHHCLCPSNWEGEDCDVDVNECRNFAGTDLGCQNGATCINRPGSYECLCRANWFGLHCTRKAKDCSGGDFEMCGHGKCLPVPSGEGITCICEQGWTTNGTGVACLTDINECESHQSIACSVNPKVECINLPGYFRCGQCPAGYEGDGYTCSDINECLTSNGGCNSMVACQNTIGSRTCGPCPTGYQGDGITCSWRGSCSMNYCHPSAICIEQISGAQCNCPDGMDGDGIGLEGCYVSSRNTNFSISCADTPCGPNGACHALRQGYTCICRKGYGGIHCDVPTNPCASNPCQNGGLCRTDDTGFRCECTALYTGNLCQVLSKTCGGVLDAEEGNILYPLTNSTYIRNAKCAWVIRTVPDKVLNVTFSKFDLEKHGDCLYDFLQIHDGRSSVDLLIGRFCGNSLPKGGNIISSQNYLYLWFRSDSTVGKSGFALHWNSVKPLCGGDLEASKHGSISSPGSPGKYPPNRDCYWHLSADYGKRIQLHFFALDIEIHQNCSYDYLAIYDGAHTTDPLLIQYCNSTLPPPIQSSSSEILVHFHSDAYGTGNGFQLSYAPLEGIPGCGGYFTNDAGDIMSPSFNGSYLNNMMCEYKIKTSPNNKIVLNFDTFSLESSFNCKFDYLKVYDGPSSDSPLVGKFCGHNYPKTYTSTSNYLFIIFKSDYVTSSYGFKITYVALCQQTFLGASGFITSPGYPFNYPTNAFCQYIISTDPGKAIQLVFQEFDLEDYMHSNCQYDNVEIRDGVDYNATLLGKYCGTIDHIPPVQTSTHNSMYIVFRSDMSVSGSGFYANYTTIDTKCGGIYRSNPGLISHPSSENEHYGNSEVCSWIIISPESEHIKLTWNRFEVEDMDDCGSDSLEIFEEDDSTDENKLGKYCGTKFPPALTTSSNRLKLIFRSDSSVRLGGFSVSYTFIDEKTHCGGVYAKSHGFIYSPGWPKKYQTNKDCSWTISVPVGQQIKLNISNFDLERPIRNLCTRGDYLEIRDGLSTFSPLIGQYCGSFKTKIIRSISNVLSIHFHSDFYLTGNGFKIEWDGTLKGCGGSLTSSSGSISSPNYPDSYNEDSECIYKITTSQGSRVRIVFTELDLEHTSRADCRNADYIEIYDGKNALAPSFGRRCYMSAELNNIATTTNNVFIKFYSDFAIIGKGFFLNYYTICNNNLTGRYGVIESPDFPNNYPTSLNCLWNITVPVGNKLKVLFTHFDLYKNSYVSRWSTNSDRTCGTDYLQWKESNAPSFSKKYCGNQLPAVINTTTNSLLIKFATGTFISRSGFRLEWVSEGCGGYLKKSYGSIKVNSSITSSGSIECEWLIETSIGKSVKLFLSGLYLDRSENCTIDGVEVYNGIDTKSPLLTKICSLNGPTSVQSTSNVMFVRLVKHSALRGTYLNSYFTSKNAGCGGETTSLSGFIYSKNYPKNYDKNLNCEWLITVPPKHRIELDFKDFDLYHSNYGKDCGDSIKIYDGAVSSNYTQIICPQSNITQMFTQNNKMLLRFTTNSYGNAKGFKIGFTAACGAEIIARTDGIISNEHYIGGTNKTCTWTIIASEPSQRISLTFTHMSLPNTNINTERQYSGNRSCSSSYVRVFSGDDDNAPQIGEYCGKKIPPMIVSTGSAITVVLSTYESQIAGHFAAHYSPVNEACGGTLTSEEGLIASPNYPRTYPNTADCEWTLTTSPGNRVYVTFEDFSLEDSERCNEDYIEIRENNRGGKLLGVYCGNNLPSNVTAAAKLYIRFHSNDKSRGQDLFLMHYEFLHGNEFKDLNEGSITSPLYPHSYLGAGEYTWRIMLNSKDTIRLVIDKLEIHSYTDICTNKLTIFDGYDDTAPSLDDLCGIISNKKVLLTTSNVAYIKLFLDETNTGALFHLFWTKPDEEIISDTEKFNCGSNSTISVLAGANVQIQSPNYPNEYDNSLNCAWVYSTVSSQHLKLHFQNFNIEEMNNCGSADAVSIYSSDNLVDWKYLKKNECKSQEMLKSDMEAARYMKIKFKTDSSITKKGFRGNIQSVCGGRITDLSGTIHPYFKEWEGSTALKMNCTWIVKVRAGRLINLRFQHFNITNNNASCTTSVTLHNGESIESPLLSSGKFCGYPHENRFADMTTSSNSLYITYINEWSRSNKFETFEIFYEEKNIECGITSELSAEHRWEIISSPNYPNPPNAYSECVWKFKAPSTDIIRIDFIDRFDLDFVDNCVNEFVEIRDGSSEISPLISRSCGEQPQTTKTNGNMLYFKYSTQLSEPRNGFKANISLDYCGGTINSQSGEITSLDYPHSTFDQSNIACKWVIKTSPNYILQLALLDMNLPESETHCATRVTVLQNNPANHSTNIIKTYCSGEENETPSSLETLSNEVIITLDIGKSAKWQVNSNSRGFKFSFNSSIPSCGGTIKTSEGYLASPGYPLSTSIRYCMWHIEVPNKSRRILLELMDVENRKYTLGIFNDMTENSPIYLQSLPTNLTSRSVFESSGPVMSVLIWLNFKQSSYKFKARFSSSQMALCGGNLEGLSGVIKSPETEAERSYGCNWNYVPQSTVYQYGDISFGYNTVIIKLNLNSSYTQPRCRYNSDPKLTIKSQAKPGTMFVKHDQCSSVETSLRVPTPKLSIKALKGRGVPLKFDLQWKLQPCGGTIELTVENINVLNIPNNYNGTLDCLWTIIIPFNNRIEMKMEGSFQYSCDDEFFVIGDVMAQDYEIGKYCASNMLQNTLNLNFRYITVQYHIKSPSNNSNIKLLTKLVTSQCGGSLNEHQYIFTSPNYPKNYNPNEECAWIITTSLGNKISLSFIDRFAVEDRPNCTKDVVIIYDWKNDEYQESARLCGRQVTQLYNSTYNKMKVVFRTDDSINMDGFKAKWSSICGGKFIATENEQFIYSPGYPRFYPPSKDCSYDLSAPNDATLSIKFLEFELEGTYPDCQYDNVTITAYSNTDYYDSGPRCGKEMPSNITHMEKATVRFMSDRFVQRKGFKLSYTTYKCGGQVNEPTILTSNTEEFYTENMNCTWYIQAPSNKIVVLKFLYVDVENADCLNDYVVVFDNFNIEDDKRIALLCGYFNKTTIVRSHGDKALVQFVSDSSANYKGFKVDVSFTYAESAGCGGIIQLNTTHPQATLNSIIGLSNRYDSYLDCHWRIFSPGNTIIRIEFTSFHVAPCENVNQTALGNTKCDCDLVEIKDGINPDSLTIGTYCGHTLPPVFFSSENSMSVRLSTDGEIESTGIKAQLSITQSQCGNSRFTVTHNKQRISSPAFSTGTVPRGIHCVYYLDSGNRPHDVIRITFISMDLQPAVSQGAFSRCSKDKLEIVNHPTPRNISIGKDYIINNFENTFLADGIFYDETYPQSFEFCGNSKPSDLHLNGDVAITLLTTADADSMIYKGFQLEFAYAGFCGNNYTDTQGKIYSPYVYDEDDLNSYMDDCYTLITAPENNTISVYFISVTTSYWNDDCFLQVYDGKDKSSTELVTLNSRNTDENPIFSTGRYMLLHNHVDQGEKIYYEMNFVTTDKGRGCGGKLTNALGVITSPMYPEIYRKQSTCEWELETPYGTQLKLRFSEFQLGKICDQNYLQLVDRKGNVISSYCSETPADYTSVDNYVKIVFVTTVNNSGTGWVAKFVAIKKI